MRRKRGIKGNFSKKERKEGTLAPQDLGKRSTPCESKIHDLQSTISNQQFTAVVGTGRRAGEERDAIIAWRVRREPFTCEVRAADPARFRGARPGVVSAAVRIGDESLLKMVSPRHRLEKRSF